VELLPVAVGADTPPWVRQLFRTVAARDDAGSAGKEKGALEKTAEKGKQLLSVVDRVFSGDPGLTAESRPRAAKAYGDYVAALASCAAATTSRAQAYQITAQAYSDDPATGKSPFFAAHAALGRLRSEVAGGKPADEMLGRLLGGPAALLWTYARNETACHLQVQWEEKVLAESQGASGHQARELLLGQDGLVGRFVKGPAAPFVGRGLRGHYAKEVLGGPIPFAPAFFAYLTRGAQAAAPGAAPRQSYAVTIRGLPTDANPEAQTKPHATRLELACQAGPQALVNLNYPISKTFSWAAGTCGDVVLQIEVGKLVLTRRYIGDQAFPQFLQEFQGGSRTFLARDFPADSEALGRLGIGAIRVNYQFSGDRPVVGQAMALPGEAPRSIATCWAP
jgi:type VI secretion system protein ImpL